MASDTHSLLMSKENFSSHSSSKITPAASHHGRLLRKPRLPKITQLDIPSHLDSNHRTLPEYLVEPEFYYEEEEISKERSGLSPPPPSEFQANSSDRKFNSASESSHSIKLKSNATRSIHSIPRSNRKGHSGRFVLDPQYREQTNIGTYVEGQALVQPYKPRGPDGLPARIPVRRLQNMNYQSNEDLLEDAKYLKPPEFTLNDFLKSVSDVENLPLEKIRQIVYSRYNYKRIQQILAEYLTPKNTTLTQVNVKPPADMPKVVPRIPQKQLLYEMAALIKEQMANVMGTDMRPMIRSLPKYSPDYKPGVSNPHTEIVLYEDAQNVPLNARDSNMDLEAPGRDALFNSPTARYFQGSRRSNSPFVADEETISPGELAVLDCIMSGGTALSLKANFISTLPDIESLMTTLTYLNLSFNDFTYVPYEVFELESLKVLKMRNNPLKEIPNEIAALKNIKTLVFSYCMVQKLPMGLFTLRKLEHLDLSYNRLTILPNEIKHLKRLRELNVEGNQLPAFPVGCLRLTRLTKVNVRNNYMHPLFWMESTKQRQPFSLIDLAAKSFKTFKLDQIFSKLPDSVNKILYSSVKCDACQQQVYGAGMRVIRPVPLLFNIKHFPIMFICCSHECTGRIRDGGDELEEILYGKSESTEEQKAVGS